MSENPNCFQERIERTEKSEKIGFRGEKSFGQYKAEIKNYLNDLVDLILDGEKDACIERREANKNVITQLAALTEKNKRLCIELDTRAHNIESLFGLGLSLVDYSRIIQNMAKNWIPSHKI